MKLKGLLLTVIMLLTLVISGCMAQDEKDMNKRTSNIESTIQSAAVTKSTDLNLYSTDVYDAKTITIDGNDFSLLLNNDAIYTINEKGTIVHKLTHAIKELNTSKEDYPLISVHLEVIGDIDGKGTSDLLVIVKEGVMKATNSIMAISYEDGTIIWDYMPFVKSKECGEDQKTCNKQLPITNYEVTDTARLYLSAGYSFYALNLTTGEKVKEYKSHNNIWDFEFVPDLTGDNYSDVVLVTQPNVLSLLNGQDFIKFKDFKIKSDLELNSYISLERNVWDIEYIETRHLLIAACENGITYEISLEKEAVKWYEVIYDGDTEDYKNYYIKMIENKPGTYEQQIKNNQMTIFFGREATTYKNINIQVIDSIDEDLLQDYIIHYDSIMTSNNHDIDSYSIISSKNGKLRTQADNEFYSASQEYYFVLEDPIKNELLFKHIKTDENIIEEIVSQSTNVAKNKISKVFYLDTQLIILTNDLEILSLIEGAEPEGGLTVQFKLYSERIRQEHEVLGEYLMIKDYDLKLELSYLKLYDGEFKEVYSHRIKSYKKLVDYKIEQNYLYLMEFDDRESNYHIRVINLIDQTIVKDVKRFKNQEFVSPYFYEDVTSDGYLEIVTTNYAYSDTALRYSFDLVDFINDVGLFNFSKSYAMKDVNYYSGSSIKILNDLNNDGMNDLVYKYDVPNGGKPVPYLILSNNDTLFEEPTELPNDRLNSTCKYDYNANGHNELIDASQSQGYKPSIYDYELNKFIPLQHSTVTYKQAFVQGCDVDFNQDGGSEFITLEIGEISPLTNGLSDDYQIELNLVVHEFVNNEFEPMFNYEFIYVDDYVNLSTLNRHSLMGEFATYRFDEASENYNMMMFKYDEYHNIILQEYDLSGNRTEKQVSNPHSHKHKEDVGTYRYGKDLSTITFNNQTYYMVTIEENSFSKHYFINTDDYKIDFITYGDHVEIYSDAIILNKTVKDLNNKFLLSDEVNKVLITAPFNTSDIEIKKSGLLGNYYDVMVKRDDVKRIRHYYTEKEYTEYNTDQLKLVLPPGNHILKLEVETTGGDLFYFNNVIKIEKNDHYLFGAIGLFVLFVVILYVSSLYVIKKCYYKK
ncbi:hypothetical protein [Haloplasma contractile]|uniref:Membrane lipoprotein n=1 Tax=Haloplasma contractile SSD-17B TaxID=1033810 RepID=F7PVJ0_9MOLU|nr:hypothetical protein [Haloplasma contractile]ERJ12842.1 membrane lipoprotein [Haloplasma contractile SSD-17B]